MKLGTALIGAVGAAAFAGTAMAESTITVVSWGGAYTKSQVEAYHKPWIASTGNKIVSEDYNGGLAEIKAQVEAGNVTWDIVDVELSDAVRACDEGLAEELDMSILPAGSDGTPAAADFIDGTLDVPCAVPTIVWSTIYAYDQSKMPQGPKTIADFFDLGKFPGKRGIRKGPKANLEMALMGDGVPADQVYDMLSTPAGVDRAFAKLDSIKSEVVWWEAGAQPPQLLADGEVAMTTAYNGRIFNAVSLGQSVHAVFDLANIGIKAHQRETDPTGHLSDANGHSAGSNDVAGRCTAALPQQHRRTQQTHSQNPGKRHPDTAEAR